MLGRRIKPSLLRRMFRWLWPQGGLRRSWQYIAHRVSRLPGSNYSIAAGFACGAAASCLPYIGFHFLLAALLALALRGNLIASAIGTAFGNPWTFPFIWVITYRIGRWVGFGGGAGDPDQIDFEGRLSWAFSALLDLDFDLVAMIAWPILKPMTVGGLMIGLVVGPVFYCLFHLIVSAYRGRRRARSEARTARPVPQAEAEVAERS
jgi:uncharacterized protein